MFWVWALETKIAHQLAKIQLKPHDWLFPKVSVLLASNYYITWQKDIGRIPEISIEYFSDILAVSLKWYNASGHSWIGKKYNLLEDLTSTPSLSYASLPSDLSLALDNGALFNNVLCRYIIDSTGSNRPKQFFLRLQFSAENWHQWWRAVCCRWNSGGAQSALE